jgi:predicted glutamine amidotransferase
MCVIATIVKKNQNKNIEEALKMSLKNFEDVQPHGSGFVGISIIDKKDKKGKKEKQARYAFDKQLTMGLDRIAENMESSQCVNYHFRTKTTGDVDLKNIHFWKRGRWIFAHNGWVSQYGDSYQAGKARKEVDSYLFFKELISQEALKDNGKIDWNKIGEIDRAKSFSGRFLLIDSELHRLYYYGDFHLYLFERDIMALCSTTIDLISQVDFFKYTFTMAPSIEIIHKKIDGVHCLDLVDNSFVKVMDLPRPVYTYTPTSVNSYSRGIGDYSREIEVYNKYNRYDHLGRLKEDENLVGDVEGTDEIADDYDFNRIVIDLINHEELEGLVGIDRVMADYKKKGKYLSKEAMAILRGDWKKTMTTKEIARYKILLEANEEANCVIDYGYNNNNEYIDDNHKQKYLDIVLDSEDKMINIQRKAEKRINKIEGYNNKIIKELRDRQQKIFKGAKSDKKGGKK